MADTKKTASEAPPPLPPAAKAAAPKVPAAAPATAAKAAAKAPKKAKLLVRLVRSASRADVFQAGSLRGLGLRKMNDVSELEDTPSVRGMIYKVQHLVAVEKG
jgi:large subunit ribosomal protein L30